MNDIEFQRLAQCDFVFRSRGREGFLPAMAPWPIVGEPNFVPGARADTAHWMWRGGKNCGHPIGYLPEGTRVYVGRVVLEWKLGRRLAAGMSALRLCGIPMCVSPFHLVEGPKKLGGERKAKALKLSESAARQVRRKLQREREKNVKWPHINGLNCGIRGCAKCALIAPDPTRTFGTEDDEGSIPAGPVPEFTDAEQAHNMLWGNVYQDWEDSGRYDDEVVTAAEQAGVKPSEFRREYGLPFGLPIVHKGVTYYG